MSKLEELTAEFCPDGVEYHKLKDVCDEIIVPMRDRPKDLTGPIPWCRIEDKEGQYFNRSLSGLGVTDKVVKQMNLKVFPVGTVICSCSASIGAYVINTQPLVTNQTFIGLVCGEKLYNKFLRYYMETQTSFLLLKATTGTIPYISRKKFEEMEVPVPPLEVQREIVRILDYFTFLSAELSAELEKRNEEYAAISAELIGREKKTSNIYVLSDLCIIEKGKTPIQKSLPGTFPLVVTTSERKTNNTYQFNTEAVCIPLVSSRGHGVASLNHVYYQEGKFALGNILCAVIPKDNSIVLAKYLYYYFEQTKDYTLVPLMKGGANVALHISDIERMKVIIPSFERQQAIVKRLEIIEKYCNEELPDEIATRKKQYEYYRNKLLTFKEKN